MQGRINQELDKPLEEDIVEKSYRAVVQVFTRHLKFLNLSC